MLTSLDIRHAYARIHGLASIDELIKFDMLNSASFPAEDLELMIDEFMLKHGFVEVKEKRTTSEVVCYPDFSENQHESRVKRTYKKRVSSKLESES